MNSIKEEEPDAPGMWSKNQTSVCKFIERRANAFDWLHNYAAKRKERVNKWMSLGSSVGGLFSGSGSLVSTLLESAKTQELVLQGLVMVFALMGLVKRWMGLGESIGKHRVMVGKYQLLAATIHVEIMKDPPDREGFANFFRRTCETEMNIRTERGSANIDHGLYEVYEKYFGDDAMEYSDLFGDIPYSLSRSSIELVVTGDQPADVVQ